MWDESRPNTRRRHPAEALSQRQQKDPTPPPTPKKRHQGYPKQPPIQEIGMPHAMITGDFERVQYLDFEIKFLKS